MYYVGEEEMIYPEKMFETMMHMIGYGHLEENFIDAVDSCDHDALLDLAGWCEDRWMTKGTLTDPLRKVIESHNKEE